LAFGLFPLRLTFALDFQAAFVDLRVELGQHVERFVA
jgi:hypothetical protein